MIRTQKIIDLEEIIPLEEVGLNMEEDIKKIDSYYEKYCIVIAKKLLESLKYFQPTVKYDS